MYYVNTSASVQPQRLDLPRLNDIDTASSTSNLVEAKDCYFKGTLLFPNNKWDVSRSELFSPDGRWIITASRDSCNIFLYDAANLKHTLNFERGEVDNGLEELSLSSNGKYLAASGCDYIYIWDFEKPVNPYKILKKPRYLFCMAISSNAEWMVCAKFPMNKYLNKLGLELINIANPHNIKNVPFKEFGLSPIFFNYDKYEWLACAEKDKIHLYQLENSNSIKEKLNCEIQNISAIATSSNGEYLAVAGIDQGTSTILLWRMDDLSSAPKQFFPKPDGTKIKKILFFPDNKWLAVAGISSENKNIIQILSIETGAYLDPINIKKYVTDMVLQKTEEGYALMIRYIDEFHTLTLPADLNAAVIGIPGSPLIKDSFYEKYLPLTQQPDLV